MMIMMLSILIVCDHDVQSGLQDITKRKITLNDMKLNEIMTLYYMA